ncbi:MAG: RNA 2',3'-cyclic phosphodiesterase [Dictyoglomus sp.]|nr:RNA 2',3'-cyclic phosphodiesterase [Dictyoglomus sp.]MCX7942530.1 RNA 2',3'-cyclic phosphodiesterase [Dictyoglomaceae bacterium]MDW8188768.1 RNA 2',3'-cyclic phosphodiesterase [Dictyoglomus sp.]
MKRLFIAIDLPLEIKKELYKIEEDLMKYIPRGVKWVEMENFHFTIRFLGETEENEIPNIIKIMDEVAKESDSFYISLKEIGAFPNFKNPRVIWIGIEKGYKEMKDLFNKLETRISKLKFKKEDKDFSPHLTLGRIKEKIRWDEKWKINIPYLEFFVEEIALFESQLTSQGPIYITLYKCKLVKNQKKS